MLLIAIPVAVLIGLSLGALGGGGSILTVPALVYLLGQDAHAATTGSLIIVGITALIGMAAHTRAGHVRVLQGSLFAMVGLVGTTPAHVCPKESTRNCCSPRSRWSWSSRLPPC